MANVQAAIEHIYPLVYEFKKPRAPKEPSKEEEEILSLIPDDSEDDDDFPDLDPDPLELEPPSKKQKIHDVSHLTKRFKGKRAGKRPPGKMNDPNEDLMFVSDEDPDVDDPGF